MQIRQTIAAPAFDKFYLEGPWNEAGIHPDIHHIKAADLGPFHCHPWKFRSTILRGHYAEEVLRPDGTTRHVGHHEGETFTIAAAHVHRIVEVSEGGCWTFIIPQEPVVRCWAFYEVRDGAVWKRDHDKPDWQPVAHDALAGRGQQVAAE